MGYLIGPSSQDDVGSQMRGHQVPAMALPHGTWRDHGTPPGSEEEVPVAGAAENYAANLPQ